MRVLGIESSCDETAAALVQDGREILTESIFSSILDHQPYRGIVPELASRRHIEKISVVVESALKGFKLPEDVDIIAATRGPGLIGSLLVGFSFAHALAFRHRIPFVSVNHLDGHIHSAFIKRQNQVFPAIFLILSGGHTRLVYARAHQDYEILGETRDDACGEAFDKVAIMLDLGYPGGPAIDHQAASGSEDAIKFPRIYLSHGTMDFSYSGMKTAVLYYLRKLTTEERKARTPDICASFQKAITDVIVKKSISAVRKTRSARFFLVGGVAANSFIRSNLEEAMKTQGISFYAPDREYCGDNAAMIASAGYFVYKNGNFRKEPMDVTADSRLIFPFK